MVLSCYVDRKWGSMRAIIVTIAILFSGLIFNHAAADDDHPTLLIKVMLSDDMKFRADNFTPENIRKDSINSKGFEEDGNYGMEELEGLLEELEEDLDDRLKKKDWTLVESQEPVPDFLLQVVIIDARNNRPTATQKSAKIMDGHKVGGATILAKLTDVSNPDAFKVFNYSKYSARENARTWSSAHIAFRDFASALSKEMPDAEIELDTTAIDLKK